MVKAILLKDIQKIRELMPIKIKTMQNEKFISFRENVKKTKPVLIHDNFVMGIKENIKNITSKSEHKIKIALIFYE